MQTVTSIRRMKQIVRTHRKHRRSIGFVPTMGYLHEGHLSLVRIGRRKTDLLVVSIFVNPLQFGPKEDYGRYPRALKRDLQLLRKEKVDVVFKPSVRAMYPPDRKTSVAVEGLSAVLCGASRPHHFRGVTTVVLKLLNIVEPDFAVFGQKDFQQALIIKRMARDLNLDVKVLTGRIIREKDGLAMSSRNIYLTPTQRKNATVLYRSLQTTRSNFQKGSRNAVQAIARMSRMIKGAGGQVDYIEVVDARTLKPVENLTKGTLIALAVFFGKTRLIDNIIL